MKKGQKHRHMFRKAGVRWALHSLMESHLLSPQPRIKLNVFNMHSIGREDLASLQEVSVGKQSWGINISKKKAALARVCIHWSVVP